MKVKLLKRLRRIFLLIERNGKYKAFEDRECSGGVYNQTEWIDRNTAIEKRRCWILKEARKYETAKNVHNA